MATKATSLWSSTSGTCWPSSPTRNASSICGSCGADRVCLLSKGMKDEWCIVRSRSRWSTSLPSIKLPDPMRIIQCRTLASLRWICQIIRQKTRYMTVCCMPFITARILILIWQEMLRLQQIANGKWWFIVCSDNTKRMGWWNSHSELFIRPWSLAT